MSRQKKPAKMEKTDVLKQYVAPWLFPPVFSVLNLCLPLWGQDRLSLRSLQACILGSQQAWTLVAVLIAWAYCWLLAPGPTVKGPSTSFGQTPQYKNNGVVYHLSSVCVFSVLLLLFPRLGTTVYLITPDIIACLNIVGFIICIVIAVKGIFFPKYKEATNAPKGWLFSSVYKFWCGSELHPSLLGVDVKQLTNCRVGLMAWQLQILAYGAHAYNQHGFQLPIFVNIILQTVYLGKFYYWEEGYFTTLDIVEDRASFYLCWGCLVYVPVLYTWSTYYMTGHRPTADSSVCWAALLLGLCSIAGNYLVDLEKQRFQQGRKTLFGGPVVLGGKLLVSGPWGVARHLNYTFEILLSLAWCLPGLGLGVYPFFYTVHIIVLLVHRLDRDNARCEAKYGKLWAQYCKQVPYKLVPYVF